MTIKLKLGEPLVDAMVAKLKNGYQARVDVINADYDDGIKIAAPDASAYYTSGIESLPAAPAILVMEGPTAIDPHTEATHSFITDTKIAVYVIDQDADRQKLGKRLQRHSRAVAEVIYDDSPQEQLVGVAPFSGQPVAFRVMLEGTTPGRVFEPEAPDAWRGIYLVVFSASAVEG